MNTNEMIGGFDPGKKGAFVTIRANTGKIDSINRIPLRKWKENHRGRAATQKSEIDWPALFETWSCQMQKCQVIFVEHIWGAAPAGKGRKDGGASQFKLGYAAGVPYGMMLSFGVPVEFITPQKWHKLLNYPKAPEGENPKGPSFDLARKLFPDSVAAFERVTVDEGVAEAALIAYSGRLILTGAPDASHP